MESRPKISTPAREREGKSPALGLAGGFAGSAGGRGCVSRREFMGAALAVSAGAWLGRASEGKRWQIGCFTRPWAQYEYRVAFDGIAAAGFKYVGLMTTKSKSNLIVGLATTTEEAAAVGAEAKQRGLKIIAMWSDEFPTDKNDGLEHLLDNAAACGCPNLLLGGTDERRAEAYYRTVAACCDYAASKGVLMGVKPHGGTNANGARCRKIIDQIGNKNFRLWYDPGNIFYYSDGKLDPVDDAAAVNGVVAGMCVKDFRPPKDVELTPGTGQVNFAKVLARLKKGGFTHGPLVVECLEHGDLDHVNAEAVKARKLLESLTGQKA
jgi:sugar phosphate isomerase/epimerase